MPWIKTSNLTGQPGPPGPPGPQGPAGPFSLIPESDLTFYVATTGSDSAGDGSQANPWATPQRAMQELWRYLLPPERQATIHIADGDYTLLEPLRLDHPCGMRITLTGGTLSGSKPTASQLNGLGASTYSPESAAANETLLRGFFQTRLLFPQSAGLQLRHGSGITIDKLLVIGSRSQVGLELASNTAITIGPSGAFALHRWGTGIQAAGSFSADGLSISSCYEGVVASAGNSSFSAGLITNTDRPLRLGGSSYLFSSGLSLQYGERGITVMGAANLECYEASLRTFLATALTISSGRVSGGMQVDTAKTGAQVTGGCMDVSASRFANCTEAGVRLAGGSFLGFSNDITDTPIGISVIHGSILKVDQLRFERCSTTALAVEDAQAMVYASRYTSCNQGITCKGGRVNAKAAQFVSPGGTCLSASRGGFIDFEGGQPSTTASPAFNTSGNGAAYILL